MTRVIVDSDTESEGRSRSRSPSPERPLPAEETAGPSGHKDSEDVAPTTRGVSPTASQESSMDIADTPEAAGSTKRKKNRKHGRLVKRHTEATARDEEAPVRPTVQEIAACDYDVMEGIAMMEDMYEEHERRRYEEAGLPLPPGGILERFAPTVAQLRAQMARDGAVTTRVAAEPPRVEHGEADRADVMTVANSPTGSVEIIELSTDLSPSPGPPVTETVLATPILAAKKTLPM